MEAKIFIKEENHMPTTLKKLISPIKDRIPLEEELLPPNERLRAGNKPNETVGSPSSILSNPSSGGFTGGAARNRDHIPISDVTGSRGLVPQTDWIKGVIGGGVGAPVGRDASLPIDSETGDKKIPEIPERFLRFLEQGAPSVDSYIPDKLGSIAGVMEQTASEFSFEDWADKTTGQQRADIQRSGLSSEDQMTILNAAPHYVETIATVQTLYANRAALGLTTSEFKELADELFAIANARDDAINHTGKFEYDRGFAPKALRWLDEREDELLAGIGKNTNEDGQDTWYNDENSGPPYDFSDSDSSVDFHRQAKYADIDQEAASKQIEDLLMKNVAEAKSITAVAGLADSAVTAYLSQLHWFYQNVKKNSPTDYKNPAIWFKTFPGLPYPEEDQVYHVFGQLVSASDLGNLNYALVGKALGIPEDLLLQQAGAAELRDHHHYSPIKSQIESIKLRDQGFGDQDDDQEMIKKGFITYNRLD